MRTLFREESRYGREISEQWEEVHEGVRGNGEQRIGSAVAATAGGGVGGIAARGRTPDRSGGVEDHSGRDRGGRDQRGRPAPSAGSGVELLALGSAIGLRGVCRAESSGRASTGAHAPRRRSSARQLRAAATRRATAAGGAGRDRGRADLAELSAGGAERARWVWDREVQREPPVRAGQRGTTEKAVREKTGETRPGGDLDRRDSSRQAGAGGGAGHRKQREKAGVGTLAGRDGEHHRGQGTVGRPGGTRASSRETLLVRDRRGQGSARRDRTRVRRARRSAALPDSQAAKRERGFAQERPGRYGPKNPQRLRDDQLRGGQSGTWENLPATGTHQSQRGAKPGRRAGGNPHRAPVGRGNAAAANVGFEQSHRVVPFHGRARGTECETLASRGPRAALDGHRITRSGEEILDRERLPRAGNPKADTESVIDSAGAGRVRCPKSRAATFN